LLGYVIDLALCDQDSWEEIKKEELKGTDNLNSITNPILTPPRHLQPIAGSAPLSSFSSSS
jgi:hypothetical protein